MVVSHKKKEILTHATACVTHRDVLLSKTSQTQNKYCMSLHPGPIVIYGQGQQRLNVNSIALILKRR